MNYFNEGSQAHVHDHHLLRSGDPGRARLQMPRGRAGRSLSRMVKTLEWDGMLHSGMEKGFGEAYAALDRLLATGD